MKQKAVSKHIATQSTNVTNPTNITRCCDFVLQVQRTLKSHAEAWLSARNRNRTCTSLPIPDFESDASTNSAIRAGN